MNLGIITGKTSTNRFTFSVSDLSHAKKFHYVHVQHPEGYPVLAYITDIEREEQSTHATATLLGYRDQNNVLRSLRTPLEPGSTVLNADDSFIRSTLGLGEKQGAYFGILEGRDKLPVYLDLNKLLTRHLAVLAKTGSGKSYTVAVLLEEIMEKNVPIIIIDPHGEYSTLKFPNDKKEDFARFGISPRGYSKMIQEYSPDTQRNPDAKPLRLNIKNISAPELMHLLPGKLSSMQIGLLYSALLDTGGTNTDLDQLLISLNMEEHPAKWTLITVIEYFKKLNLFSNDPTSLQELIQPGKCSLLNLRGIPQEVQEIIVYKLAQDLFTARKNRDLPPFFLVVEEAHNYAPERSFGEAKSSIVLRQIASEGRKFGVGLAVITQRPARLEKNILSQCNTQIILKMTNPHDIKAVSSSLEGLTSEIEDELSNLHIGTALVVGVVDLPLLVEVRPRKSKHGGEAVNILETFADFPAPEISDDGSSGETKKAVLNILKPHMTKDEIKTLLGKKLKNIKTILVPALMLTCKQKQSYFQLLFNLTNSSIVTDYERGTGIQIPTTFEKLSEKEEKIFQYAMKIKKDFTPAEAFAASGYMFSETYDLIQTLVRKKYLLSKGQTYTVHEQIQVFSSLADKACHEKNDFVPFPYDQKLIQKHSAQEIVNLFQRFITIENATECYFVKYDVEYTS